MAAREYGWISQIFNGKMKAVLLVLEKISTYKHGSARIAVLLADSHAAFTAPDQVKIPPLDPVKF